MKSAALLTLPLLLVGCSSAPRWEQVEVTPAEGLVDGFDALAVVPGRVFGLYTLSLPTLEAHRARGRLACSEDGGRTWTLREGPPVPRHIVELAAAVDAGGRCVLLAGGPEGDLLRSDDEGATWTPLAV